MEKENEKVIDDEALLPEFYYKWAFLALPGIGPLCQFFPLNFDSVPLVNYLILLFGWGIIKEVNTREKIWEILASSILGCLAFLIAVLIMWWLKKSSTDNIILCSMVSFVGFWAIAIQDVDKQEEKNE